MSMRTKFPLSFSGFKFLPQANMRSSPKNPVVQIVMNLINQVDVTGLVAPMEGNLPHPKLGVLFFRPEVIPLGQVKNVETHVAPVM